MTRAGIGWLPFPEVATRGVRLYCLPPTAGAAARFLPWASALADVAVVRPVELPGHGRLAVEAPYAGMANLVYDLATVITHDAGKNDWALYGHSLGALTAYEVAHEILTRTGRAPRALIVSGCPAPHRIDLLARTPIAKMSDAEILADLRMLDGTPETVLDQPMLVRKIVETYRADAAVRESWWNMRTLDILPAPITAITGRDDPRVTVADAAAWHVFTSGHFTLNTLPGGHFAALDPPTPTLRWVREALT
jgi:surfactin synthase thioesterase subunit